MITEEKFLETIDNYQLLNFFKPEQKAGDMNVIEEVEETEVEGGHDRKNSDYLPSSTEFIEIQEKFRRELEISSKKEQKMIYLAKNGSMQAPCTNTTGLNGSVKKGIRRQAGSMLTIPTYARKNLKLTNNVASLVKKYATYIFNELKLNKAKDEIKFPQFLTIVRNHQKIFNIYFEGFHSYIWMLEDNATPEFLKITPFIEGSCMEMLKDQRNERYLKYIKTTIFVFSKKKSSMPVEVKNMEGLIVDAKNNENGFGMLIKHRDGVYPEKEYYFENEGVQKEWLRVLDEFKENSIYNKYQIM
jgi:hypothetical protein